jgi:hypothetical protein
MVREWLWDRSGLLLALSVLGGLVAGLFLPGIYDVVVSLAYGQIVMAIVVAIREARRLAADRGYVAPEPANRP